MRGLHTSEKKMKEKNKTKAVEKKIYTHLLLVI